MSTHSFLTSALLFSAIAAARPIEAEGLELVDLSESGEALALGFEGSGPPGGPGNPVTVRLGPSGAFDVLDFEVRGAAVGERLHFRLLDPPAGTAPSTSHGEFRWSPVEALHDPSGAGAELRFEVQVQRAHFLVRLRELPDAGPDAPYYTWGRFVDYMVGILDEPLAEVTQVGTSIQGRPLFRIVIDDPTLPSPKKTVLMVVRQHGNEYGSSYLLEGFLDLVLDRKPRGGLERILGNGARARDLRRVRWIVYPNMNPDGSALNQRYNANGVDLNRDWDRLGCSASQEPETFAIQCDVEALDALYGIHVGGDHHGWSGGTHGGYRYAPATSPSNTTLPEYQEAKKDTTVVTRHDPSQWNWIENGGTTGMLRVEMFLRSNFLLHTSEYDSVLSSPRHFRAKGRAWADAMVDTLFAPRFTDAQGQGKRAAKIGDGLWVTLDDDDENVSPEPLDTVQVTVRDLASGDVETLTLAELPRGGLFRNVAPLVLAGGAAVPGNGVLETSSGAQIVASYVDDDYARDESSAALRVK